MDVFAALADPIRRHLLAEVAAAPKRVVDLAAGQAVSRPAVSRHLRVLGEAGLIEATARGRERHYVLRPQPLGQVRDFLEQLTRTAPRLTAQLLDALDTEVRRTGRERRSGGPRRSQRTTATATKEETA